MNVVLLSTLDVCTLCFVRCTYSLFLVLLIMFIFNSHYTQLRNMYLSVS